MSSSSSASSENGNGANGGRGGNEYEGPPRIRPRAINEVWPEPFLEALAAQVAIDASRFVGRLAAAQALANVFQVCSTWRAVSRSDLLWHRLTRRIWNRTTLIQDTWREEYIYRHRTARNFRTRTSSHFTLQFDPADFDDPNDPDALICRCLALSDHYLACGFVDGAIRLYDLQTRLHTRTFRPQHRDHMGRFSRAVSGIIISNRRLVFASLNGDIHLAMLNGNAFPRRVHYGDMLTDGVLIDFAGRGQWWVGLYVGVPGRAFHIWNGTTEELTFVGGLLTDPDSVTGWHMLNDITELLGRVRVTSEATAIACTRLSVMSFDLRNQGVILGEDDRGGFMVSCFDVYNSAYVSVDSSGVARVHRADNIGGEEICSFNVRVQRGMMGCMNGGYALMCAGGVVRIWEIEQRGELLYSFRERIGEVNAMAADERHVAAASSEGTIHVWDFGA
ncbi:Transcriptional regulator STERILE APETALA, putative [Ricinus communis]|uniref:Transcriptional regulator STERILE APETALA, putative n=1 Tax=Ricinus communis TaxID=3988 RepID=B9SW51_RICCO|nr:Transcriptional regulator STERILE APETALA, putative [Ricinus communis]